MKFIRHIRQIGLIRLIRKGRKVRLIAVIGIVAVVLPLAINTLLNSTVNQVKADSLYSFDEGYGTTSAVHDSAGSGTAGTISNAVWKTEDLCKSGKCLFFDGTGDYVSFGDDANFDFAGATNFTIGFWFRTTDITTGQRDFVTKYRGDDTEGGYKIYIDSNGKVIFGIDDDNSWGPDDSVTSPNPYDDNNWHHVTAVKTGTTSITLYIDAQSAGTTPVTASGTLVNDDAFTVGSEYDGTTNPYTGFIDELKVYTSTARTSDQVKTDVLGTTTTRGTSASFGPDQSWISNGLVGYWKMDEASGDATDSSGNGGTLTNSGTATYTTTKFGNGVALNGTTQYLYVADTVPLSVTGGLTISAWVKPTTLSNFNDIVAKHDGAFNRSYLLTQTGTGALRFALNGTVNYVQTGTGVVSASTLAHVTAVYQASSATAKIYVNGVKSLTTISGTIPTSITDNASRFQIGADTTSTTPTNLYDGQIDDVRVYNRALNSSEVQKLYNWAPGPVLQLKMDENTGTSSYDTSTHGNNGTLTNTPFWASGKFGSGVKYDGINDFVTVADSNSLDLSSDFTLEVWFNPTTSYSITSDYLQGLLDKGEYRIFLDKSDGKLKAELNNGGTTWAVSYDNLSGDAQSYFVSDVLAVYNGYLYAGMAGLVNRGDVWRFNGSTWAISYDNVAADAQDYEAVSALAVYNGKLYAGMGTGTNEGDVWSYDGNSWAISYDNVAADAQDYEAVLSLAVYNGKLYAGMGTGTNEGDVWSYDGNSWAISYDNVTADDQDYEQVNALAVYHNNLYAGVGTNANEGDVWSFDGTTWAISYDNVVADSQDYAAVYALAVYNGKLYSGMGNVINYGDVWSYDGSTWAISYDNVSTDDQDYETVRGLAVYHDRLYAGMGSGVNEGDAWTFDGSTWAITYDNISTDDQDYESLYAFAVYNGKNYTCTGNSDTGEGDVWVLDAGNQIASTTTSWAANTWYHAALTKSGTTVSLFLNGVLQTQNTFSSATVATNALPLLVGKAYGTRGTGVGEGLFKGILDQTTIYNYVRTLGQITEDMNAGHPAQGSPVGSATSHWKFDEGYLTTANDFGTSDSDLTLSSATAWTNSGKFGKAFDGADNRRVAGIDDTDLEPAASEDFSISAWFKSDGATTAATEYLVSKGGTGAGGYQIYFNTSGQIVCGIDDDATSFPEDLATTSTDYYDTSWHHLVCVRDIAADKLYLYVDGQLVTYDADLSATGTMATSSTFYLGDQNATDDTDEFLGNIDEVKFYRLALTVDQVKVEYNQGSSQSLGVLGTNSTYEKQAAAQEYCIPGDTTSCASPVGEWRLDENSDGIAVVTRNDTSGNNNNLTDNNTSKSIPGRHGNAAYFTRTNSEYLSITDAAQTGLDLSGDFTISFWLYDVFDTNTHSIISKQQAYNTDYAYQIQSSGGSIYAGISDDGTNRTEANGGTGFEYDQWVYVSVVVKVGQNISIFVNGNLADTPLAISEASIYNSSYDFQIGGDGVGSNYFNGAIDDVKIYNYARTRTQIIWDMDRGAPIAWYKLDETSLTANCATNSVFDSSGNGLHGHTCPNGSGQTPVAGKFNSAIDLDGTEDYIDIGQPASLIINNYVTLSAWFKRGTLQSGFTAVAGKNGYYLIYFNNDDLRWYLRNGTSDFTFVKAITDTNWHHLIGTYDGTTAKAYLDGNLAISQVKTYSPTGSYDFLIGNLGGGFSWFFDGLIDDVRVYNYPLTATQVKTVYNDGAAVRF